MIYRFTFNEGKILEDHPHIAPEISGSRFVQGCDLDAVDAEAS